MYGPQIGTRSFEAALRDLKDDKDSVRAAAVRDLAVHAGERRGQVVPALVEALASDRAPAVRSAAALALADVQARETLDALIEACDDDTSDVRQMALVALGELGDPRAEDAVTVALDDEDPAIRFQAVIAFARVSADAAQTERLLAAATRDDDPHVCRIALRMAEELGDDDTPVSGAVLERAVAMLGHDDPSVRVTAAVVAARSGRREASPVLVKVVNGELATGEQEDEAAAIDLCGELGLDAAIPGLERRAFGGLFGAGDRLAWQARVALANLGHARAQEWIHRELRAWTRERRTLAVAAAGRARLASARATLEAMRGKPGRADQDAVAEALGAIEEER